MATFGEDQFDREIKQLKTKLAQKGEVPLLDSSASDRVLLNDLPAFA